MRFRFVDRILALEPGRRIEALKNVASTEDVFADHFPGYPVLPGALVIEVFEQSTQLLIGVTHGFERVGRLERVARASFRHAVRPGDQVQATCERTDDADGRWSVSATARVGGRLVASAVLELALETAGAGARSRAQAERLRAMERVLRQDALELVTALQARG